MRIELITSLMLFMTACQDGQDRLDTRRSDSLEKSADTIFATQSNNDIEIGCDSIFGEKGLKIILTDIRDGSADENARIFVFKLIRNFNGQKQEIFKDTIESIVQEIKFTDFNGDKIKDILIQNYSDARSNWTYHLFLVNKQLDNLKKIRGFSEIKNPTYLSAQDVVTNYVVSGTNWTSFYKIQTDSVVDLGILIEDDLSDDGSYKRKYDRAISDIGRRMKNNR